ncbi:MAG: site-2 protease family protein [Candidatus Marinimicrobia bacterium]|nr:site-2 protease family protein [Candidatus Neomarinimicrobiota bacterium]|tara:strand:+ start:4230 stop:4847 length:618 start_codon:yes stop_codon:yes gene_type:complete
MLFRLPPEVLVLLIPVLLFALVFHEFSHGWVAYKLGDPTAKNQGRLTLNPIAHLDPFGSMMILFVGFGWAKPVPVDSRYLANPREDMMKIAFAGPASNLFLALIGGVLIRLTGYAGPLTSMLILFTQINISLAVFNMIPIPPLDGSQIFSGIMIRRNPQLVMQLQMYGPQILVGLILFGMFTGVSVIWALMSPFVNFFMFLFAGM